MSLLHSIWVVYSLLLFLAFRNNHAVVSCESYVCQITAKTLDTRQVFSTQGYLRRAFHTYELRPASLTHCCGANWDDDGIAAVAGKYSTSTVGNSRTGKMNRPSWDTVHRFTSNCPVPDND